jgi:hypothetical protein
MLSIFAFKRQHIGFTHIPDEFIAAAALKFISNKNLAVCSNKLLFLGVQALNLIIATNAVSNFRRYVHELRNTV